MLKRYIAIVSAVILLFGFATVYAAGSASDPVVSLSYIRDTFFPRVEKLAADTAEPAFRPRIANGAAKAEAAMKGYQTSLTSEHVKDYVVYTAYVKTLDRGVYFSADQWLELTLAKGERLVAMEGTSFIIRAGGARLEGDATAELVNATSGLRVDINTGASYARYVVSSDDVVAARALSDGAKVAVQGKYQVVPAFRPLNGDVADVLKRIGLFRGSNLGFELDREATRLEALIMFLRLIGEEDAALSYTGTHPFTDVPKWAGDTANKYVAYAHQKGYTNGVSATKFGSYSAVTAEQYMTFVLRALGYQDGVDFQWKGALDRAVQLGILSANEQDMLHRRGFYRDFVALLSGKSLNATRKGSTVTLIQNLVNRRVLTEQQMTETLTAMEQLK